MYSGRSHAALGSQRKEKTYRARGECDPLISLRLRTISTSPRNPPQLSLSRYIYHPIRLSSINPAHLKYVLAAEYHATGWCALQSRDKPKFRLV